MSTSNSNETSSLSLNTSPRTEDLESDLEDLFSGTPIAVLLHQYAFLIQESTKQANDSTRIFQIDNKIEPSMFLQYPDSPTAKKILEAFSHFTKSQSLLQEYQKDTVDDQKDCEYLKPAFEGIAYGHICENSLYELFKPTENTLNLVNQYLSLQPEDILAEYARFLILNRRSFYHKSPLSSYESEKSYIRNAEKFAYKLQKNKTKMKTEPNRKKVLIDLLYCLSARYVSTNQSERALDTSQKCYDLDTSNYGALYGIAFKTRDEQKSIGLFRTFIEMSPVCDKKYPNAHYMIAFLFFQQKNFKEASRYYFLAEKAESKRLPFLPPVQIPQKQFLLNIKRIMQSRPMLA